MYVCVCVTRTELLMTMKVDVDMLRNRNCSQNERRNVKGEQQLQLERERFAWHLLLQESFPSIHPSIRPSVCPLSVNCCLLESIPAVTRTHTQHTHMSPVESLNKLICTFCLGRANSNNPTSHIFRVCWKILPWQRDWELRVFVGIRCQFFEMLTLVFLF